MPSIIEDVFGRALDPISMNLEPIRRFTFANGNKMKVQVITLGATITSIYAPDNRGLLEDVVLGFDTIGGYTQRKTNPYFGATVGRVTDRIGHGFFKIDERRFNVSKNLRDTHTLHGGFIGFSDVIWSVVNVNQETCSLQLQYISPHREEGFPGEVTATVAFSLTQDNCFHMRLMGSSTMPTPINLTNHTYFNLRGHGAGRGALYDTHIFINADHILDTDYDDIPTGKFEPVENTPYDFRELKELGTQMMRLDGQGFDDNFCINLGRDDNYRINLGEKSITVVAKAVCPKSGRWLEVASDQPGLRFYTGNALPNLGAMERPIVGKDDKEYVRQCAFCFQTQGYPDAVNHPNFPSVILKPGQKYEHNVLYKFGVTKDDVDDVDYYESITDYSEKSSSSTEPLYEEIWYSK